MPYSFSGQAFLVSKKIHDIIGFFNEDYGLYGEEDADYCMRCHHAKIKKYTYEANSMLKNNGLDGSLYQEYSTDKVNAHNVNVGFGNKTGIFALNLFLYKNKLRPLNVIRKYMIERINDHNIKITENPAYEKWYDKLLQCLDIYKNNIDHFF